MLPGACTEFFPRGEGQRSKFDAHEVFTIFSPTLRMGRDFRGGAKVRQKFKNLKPLRQI